MASSCAALAVLGSGTTSAFASAPTQDGSFLISSGRPTGVAIDESTGNVFVAADKESGVVDVFGEAGGSPSGGLPATLTGDETPAKQFGFEGRWIGVSVDNSTGTAAGSIYVADPGESADEEVVDRFKPSGAEFQYESQLTGEPTHLVEPKGVATDADGDVYVSSGDNTIREFSPAGAEIASFVTARSIAVRSVAVDSTGDIFVGGGEVSGSMPGKVLDLRRSSDTATSVEAITEVPGSESVEATGIDRATNTLYVALPERVVEYSLAGGAPVQGEDFAREPSGIPDGIAVNEKTGKIYIAEDEVGKGQVFIYQSAPPHFPLTVFIAGEGEVISIPAGIKCPSGGCSHAFEGEVTLTEANAGTGYEFAGWIGCKKVSATTCTVDVTAVSEVTAVFLKAGKEGPAGEDGPPGKEGAPGAAGKAGAVGLAGEKGPSGAQGAQGSAGPPGAQGPAGPVGKVELVTCVKIKAKQHCTTKLVSGTVKFTTAGLAARATLSRNGVLYATGTARRGRGRMSLRLLPVGRLRAGRYTLTLMSGSGRHERISHEPFVLR